MMTLENNNTEKLSLFVEDAKKLGLKILKPCINKSSYEFVIENISSCEFGIRYSLSSVKNVGTDAIKKIIQIREKDGEFKNIDDFLNRVPYSLITKNHLKALLNLELLTRLNQIEINYSNLLI